MKEETEGNAEEETTEDSLSEAWDKMEEIQDGDGDDSDGGEDNGLDDLPTAEDGGLPAADNIDGDDSGSDSDGSSDGADSPADKPDDKAGEASSEDDKAPVGLSASAREVWKDTPKEVKAEFTRREKEFAQGIQRYAEGAKRAQAMDNTLQPYQQYLAMNGGAPKALGDLLTTAATLQSGSPVQRAQVAAQIIKDFSIDLPSLDSILSGSLPSPGQPQPAGDPAMVQKAIDDAMLPYQQHMQQFQSHQQRVQQNNQQVIVGEIDAFGSDPKNEFYTDVRMDMADILDMAANRNLDMSLKDAYDRACALNPEISNVISARVKTASLASKRKAASSISGNPGGSSSQATPEDVRATLEMAWENSGRV